MKRIKAISALALALTMAFGMNVFAASSSTTTNTSTSSVVATESYIVYPSSGTTTRAAVAKSTTGEAVRVVADYSQVTSKKFLSTVTEADEATYEALSAYVEAVAPGQTVLVDGIRLRMYNVDESVVDGFGTFTAKIGVGAQYNGMTATAYIYSIDGTVTAVPVTIVNGQAIVPMTVMGVVSIVLD